MSSPDDLVECGQVNNPQKLTEVRQVSQNNIGILVDLETELTLAKHHLFTIRTILD